MFGLILTGSQLIIALGAFGAVLTGVWKAGQWVYKWAKRIEKVVGTNGGSTVFEQFSLLKTMIMNMSDQVAMQSSISDLIPTPSFTFGPDGEVSSVTAPFVVATHLTAEELQHGQFRGMLGDEARLRWDEAVSRQQTFIHLIVIGGQKYHFAARPKFNEGRFLGWRAALEAA